MGLRDRLRLLVRPAAPPVAAPRSVAPPPVESAAGPPLVSIPRRVVTPPAGVPVLDADREPPGGWAGAVGPVVVVSAAGGALRASLVAERIAAFGVRDVMWCGEGGP